MYLHACQVRVTVGDSGCVVVLELCISSAKQLPCVLPLFLGHPPASSCISQELFFHSLKKMFKKKERKKKKKKKKKKRGKKERS